MSYQPRGWRESCTSCSFEARLPIKVEGVGSVIVCCGVYHESVRPSHFGQGVVLPSALVVLVIVGKYYDEEVDAFVPMPALACDPTIPFGLPMPNIVADFG